MGTSELKGIVSGAAIGRRNDGGQQGVRVVRHRRVLR